MAADTARSTIPSESPVGSLLVVTGASHTGKTSVIQALLPRLDPPVAVLGVDDLLRRTLVRPEGDPWKEIPLAYELIERQVAALLERGWLAIVESTFTYVPPEGEGELHDDTLSQLIALAEQQRAPWLLCRIEAPAELTLSRSDQTKRLPSELVAAIYRLHAKLTLPVGTLKLSTAEHTPEEVAENLASRLSDSLRQK